MLARHLPDPAERAWVEPAILALLGQQAAPVAADELFSRWRLLFERLSATGTVVLVFEDLHWADPATLDFIDHLLEWSRSFPILVVTLARPELVDQRPEWGLGRRNFASVALDPLPEPAMRALLAGLVPDLPEDAARRIVERAEGIPLYAVETIRMLLAEKRLVEDGDRYTPVGDLSTIAVPETLTALIAARLDSLEPADRSLVLDAAVLGQRFTIDALAAIVGAGRGRPRAAPPGARPPRAAEPRGGPPLTRARPVRLRPGAHPRGRVQHAREARPQGAPPRRGAVLRDGRVGRARRRARGPLPRRARERARRAGGRRPRHAGAARPPRRRRARGRPRVQRPGSQPAAPGAHGRDKSGRSGRPPRAARARRRHRRALPRVIRGVRGGRVAPSHLGRPPRARACPPGDGHRARELQADGRGPRAARGLRGRVRRHGCGSGRAGDEGCARTVLLPERPVRRRASARPTRSSGPPSTASTSRSWRTC